MKSTNIPLIRTSNLIPFINFLDLNNCQYNKSLDNCKLTKKAILNPSDICTEFQMWSFIEQLSKQEGIENLGIIVAEKNNIENLGILGSILLESLTLQDCLYNLMKFVSKHHSDAHRRFWIKSCQEKTYFCFQDPYNLKETGCFQATGYTLIFILNLLKVYLGTQWKPKCIYIQKTYQKYQKQFESRPLLQDIQFFYKENYFAIPFSNHLVYQVRNKNNKFVPKYNPEIISYFLSFEPPQNLSASIKLLLKTVISLKEAQIEEIAYITNISKRSLNRYLALENTNFRKILAETRYEIAITKLANYDLSVSEIAFDLGYSDTAHFTRAFKKWSGVSPSYFRQMQINT